LVTVFVIFGCAAAPVSWLTVTVTVRCPVGSANSELLCSFRTAPIANQSPAAKTNPATIAAAGVAILLIGRSPLGQTPLRAKVDSSPFGQEG